MSTSSPPQIDRYDPQQTYQWNYDHAPEPVAVDEPAVPGSWTFCGLPVGSPLGVAAGPLLNGRWCLYYAGLGFDVVTYKTVRSDARACFPLPNLLPVACGELPGGQLHGGEPPLSQATKFEGSWAVSFGMPSQSPEVWEADVGETRRRLPANKLLSVSVVGTMQPGWSLERLAEDYAACAQAAAVHGADVVEFNLSCPNVTTCDGELYRQPADSVVVARRMRDAVGRLPLVAKVGHFRSDDEIAALIDALAPYVDALATTNTVAAKVIDDQGRAYFEGHARGICGRAILDASVRQVEAIAEHIARRKLPLRVIGVGGIFSAADVGRYLNAGAEAVQLATAVMIDPRVGIAIRRDLANAKLRG